MTSFVLTDAGTAALLALALVSCAPSATTSNQPSAPVMMPEAKPADWFVLREPIAFDGDTLYISVTERPPPELTEMSIRVLGIDTPEIHGKCAAEKELAIKARDYTRSLVTGHTVTVQDLEHDKYGARYLAVVLVDGQDLGQMLIDAGLARPYDGKGPRQSWC